MDKGCSINGNNEEKANAATVKGMQAADRRGENVLNSFFIRRHNNPG